MSNTKKQIPIAWTIVLPFLIFTIPSIAFAQETETLHGVVLELGTDQPLQYVEITNLETDATAESDEKGNFNIQVRKDGRLRFEYPGYRTDTLVVIEFDVKRVYMTPNGSAIRIDEVQIKALSDNQLAMEIERAQKGGQVTDVSQHRGGIRISPSRWFGREGRQARQRKELLIAEQERRKVDARFTPLLISSITPLKGQQLELYMTKYRPTVDFLSSANDEELRLYIMDAYAEFEKLTPEELAEIKAPDGQ